MCRDSQIEWVSAALTLYDCWRRFARQSRGPSLRYGALPSSLPLLAIFLSLSRGQSNSLFVVKYGRDEATISCPSDNDFKDRDISYLLNSPHYFYQLILTTCISIKITRVIFSLSIQSLQLPDLMIRQLQLHRPYRDVAMDPAAIEGRLEQEPIKVFLRGKLPHKTGQRRILAQRYRKPPCQE